MKDLAPFDASDYLDDEAVIAEYISAALENEDPAVLLQAIADVAKARGMMRLAEVSGLDRQALDLALSPGARPGYDTVLRLVRALGVELHASPMQSERPLALIGPPSP